MNLLSNQNQPTTYQSGTKEEDVKAEREKMKMKAIKTETSPPTNLLPPPFCIADKFFIYYHSHL